MTWRNAHGARVQARFQARARDTGAGAVSAGTRARATGTSRGGTAEWAAPRRTAGACPRWLTCPSDTCHVFGAAMSEALRLASDTSHALSAAFTAHASGACGCSGLGGRTRGGGRVMACGGSGMWEQGHCTFHSLSSSQPPKSGKLRIQSKPTGAGQQGRAPR